MREEVEQLFPAYGRAAYRFLKVTLGGAMRGLYRVRVDGLDNVPSTGPGIVAANHISFIDSLFIPLTIPRRVTYLAKAEYWDSWKTKWFFELVGQIPVRRDDSAKAQAALEAGMRVLSHEGLLGIYPEGTRSPDGRAYRAKTGVARMAAAAGCPVIPVGLVGTREIMPKEAKMPKARGEVAIRFGQPVSLTQADVDADPLACRAFADELMYRICQLSGQEYCDGYADRSKPQPRPERATAPAA